MTTDQLRIEIDIAAQKLRVIKGEETLDDYDISTARNGPGEQENSECTPRGQHEIVEKIGGGCPANTVFVGRCPTGEIYRKGLKEEHPERDWILTRILWLGGVEQGINKGGQVDSRNRYIYLHGTPEDVEMGIPGSRGCVRMRNADVIELFDLVAVGTRVMVTE